MGCCIFAKCIVIRPASNKKIAEWEDLAQLRTLACHCDPGEASSKPIPTVMTGPSPEHVGQNRRDWVTHLHHRSGFPVIQLEHSSVHTTWEWLALQRKVFLSAPVLRMPDDMQMWAAGDTISQWLITPKLAAMLRRLRSNERLNACMQE
ncbi:uncharacterized protein EI90DRAFT_3014303 [Cantharellus anzutake]|uniref:uncharacterized protein n=1 Tax=Cantharellus anzutake TaxID=1750568 RepID=UPI0019068D13|nr:uncharacterized protein EI90DRAFT_3014303 [Cantharellus anzutake]KAF8336616.1 hypothetical protein EI90DRAFT_3014303 [Cantharellus anzutake]